MTGCMLFTELINILLWRAILLKYIVPSCHVLPFCQLGSLKNLLQDAPAAFPTLLQIGHKVLKGDHDSIYSIRAAIASLLDSRPFDDIIAMPSALLWDRKYFTILCNMVVTHAITVKFIRLEMLFTTKSVALIVSL